MFLALPPRFVAASLPSVGLGILICPGQCVRQCQFLLSFWELTHCRERPGQVLGLLPLGDQLHKALGHQALSREDRARATRPKPSLGKKMLICRSQITQVQSGSFSLCNMDARGFCFVLLFQLLFQEQGEKGNQMFSPVAFK